MKKYQTVFRFLLGIALIISFVFCPLTVEGAEDPIIVVSLGDSYSSGEGIPPFGLSENLKDKVQDLDWLAHRSERAWQGMLQIPGLEGELKDYRVRPIYTINKKGKVTISGYEEPKNGGAWYFVASSGATTKHMENVQKKDYRKYTDTRPKKGRRNTISGTVKLRPQLEVFDYIEGKVDYVTITIGGNDLGFSKIVTEAALTATTTRKELSKAALQIGKPSALAILNPNKVYQSLEAAKAKFYNGTEEDPTPIRDKIKGVYEAINEKCGEGTVILVAGYPTLLDRDGNGVFFSKQEADWINNAAIWLDEELSKLVEEYGKGNVIYVPVKDEFAWHEAYSEQSFINEIMLPSKDEDIKIEPYSSYSMHPNRETKKDYNKKGEPLNGAAAYALCVQQEIDHIEDIKAELAAAVKIEAPLAAEESAVKENEPAAEAEKPVETEVDEWITVNDENEYASLIDGGISPGQLRGVLSFFKEPYDPKALQSKLKQSTEFLVLSSNTPDKQFFDEKSARYGLRYKLSDINAFLKGISDLRYKKNVKYNDEDSGIHAYTDDTYLYLLTAIGDGLGNLDLRNISGRYNSEKLIIDYDWYQGDFLYPDSFEYLYSLSAVFEKQENGKYRLAEVTYPEGFDEPLEMGLSIEIVTESFYESTEYAEYSIPQINLDGEEILWINEEIWDDCYTRYVDTMEARDLCLGISYRYHVEGDVLSLVIQENYTNTTEYMVINCSISNGIGLNQETVLEEYGVSEETFQTILWDSVKSWYEGFGSGDAISSKIKATYNSGNLEFATPFIDEDGRFKALVYLYLVGGREVVSIPGWQSHLSGV